jgi:uncharacterized protein DUF3551
MKISRRTSVSAAGLLVCSALFAVASWVTPAAAARSGVPPFCVLRGGPKGPGTLPQLCRFFNYQECLQAAADLHGNCVVNIDYHGEVSLQPAPTETRRRH